MKKLELLYRSESNYKTTLNVYRYSEDVEGLKVGDMITMGDHGTPDQSQFFDSEYHRFKYDSQDDHDGLEVVSIENPEQFPSVIKVFLESNGASSYLMTFASDEVYNRMLPYLERWAALSRQKITESEITGFGTHALTTAGDQLNSIILEISSELADQDIKYLWPHPDKAIMVGDENSEAYSEEAQDMFNELQSQYEAEMLYAMGLTRICKGKHLADVDLIDCLNGSERATALSAFRSKEIESAKAVLREHGFWVDGLLSVEDVYNKGAICSQETAFKVLEKAIHTEWMGENINVVIDDTIDEMGLTKFDKDEE